MFDWFGKLKKDHKGSSMVVVIVALAFVGILGATIMWMALNNFRMKATDAQHKRSFYSAETVMEQIVAGVQGDASEAIDKAYENVMQKYSGMTEAQRQEEFRKEYLVQLQRIFGNGSLNTYEISTLRNYVEGYGDTDNREFTNGEGKGELYTTVGDVEADRGTMERFDSSEYLNENYVALRNVHLEFTDNNGFVSMISTDLVIAVPEVKFTQSETMPDIFQFAMVANEELTDVEGAMGSVEIAGNLYGGEKGITIHHQWKLLDGDMIVTDDAITLDGNTASLQVGDIARMNMPMLWARDIEINRADAAALNIYARTYIKDDLSINASNAGVTLAGEYYGYGNPAAAVAATAAPTASAAPGKSSQSSAIIINGVNASLDMTGLDTILLAGHSYIGIGAATGQLTPEEAELVGGAGSNEDILMGESIAIKGDQIAYLVPDECIGVLDGVDVYGKNPMSGTEYEALQTELAKCDAEGNYADADGTIHKLSEVDYTKIVEKLGKPIGAYTGSVKKIFYPSNGETLVYYYLQMDEENANRYFADYYQVEKEKIDQYFQIYTGGIVSKDSYTRINTQGNWLSSAEVAADGAKLNAPQRMDTTTLGVESRHYGDMFDALTAKLITNYYEVSSSDKARSIFENVIITDDAELDNFIGYHGGAYRWETDDGIQALITYGDYDYSAREDDLRLIVAKGDVTLSADFTGVIIAGGTVTINSGVKITNAAKGEHQEEEELTRVLQQPFDPTDSTSVKPIDFFRNGTSYILAGTVLSGVGTEDISQDAIDFSEVVRYENWVKQ